MDRKFLVNEVGVGVKNSIVVSYGKGKEGGRKEWLTGVVGVELGKDRERGKGGGRVVNEANSIRQGFLVWVRGLKTKQIRKEATATPTATHLSTSLTQLSESGSPTIPRDFEVSHISRPLTFPLTFALCSLLSLPTPHHIKLQQDIVSYASGFLQRLEAEAKQGCVCVCVGECVDSSGRVTRAATARKSAAH